MRISFDIEDAEGIEYKTSEQWEDYKRQLHDGAPRETTSSDPDLFPCIAIPAGYSMVSCGPDERHFAFIYHYHYLPD